MKCKSFLASNALKKGEKREKKSAMCYEVLSVMFNPTKLSSDLINNLFLA